MDYTIKIGGEAGQGIHTVGGTLASFFAKSGYHVFTNQDYESRIRGGHNFFQIRLSDKPVMSLRQSIDILVAMDRESIPLHEKELSEIGHVVYDSSVIKEKHEKQHFLDVPFTNIAVEHGGKVLSSMVAVGSVLGMMGMETDILLGIIKKAFDKKGEEIINNNLNAAMAGHEFARGNCNTCSFSVVNSSELRQHPKMLISGNEAIGFGAVASGLKFFAAYPMTPSTGIMNYIADKEEEYGIIVEQAEDEISAINMSLGASFAGVRSMTGTSGGGFALMTEGLSLAGMTETPIVIALAQRPGPATGLPTRTEQGDLQFALYAGHGEFPRIILAPGSPEQAFYLTGKAFDLAEKYQVPVIIMTDQYLADTQWTYDTLDLSRIQYKDYRLRGDELNRLTEYKRHAYTETGVTPLGIPGASKHLVVTDSDEHDEDGHLVEDAETRLKMMDKRLFKKMPLIREEIAPPELYGNSRPEILLVGWGSTYGIMKEAVDLFSLNGNIAMMHFSEIFPLPSQEKYYYLKVIENAKLAVCIENNATGQFARYMRAETGYEFAANINWYDGRPFTLEGLVGEINEYIRGL